MATTEMQEVPVRQTFSPGASFLSTVAPPIYHVHVSRLLQTVADCALRRAQFFPAHALKPPVTASSWPFHRASFASVCS
ncbi:hypothetical protein IscW_ISCW014210 [Ixodes scapularis]|uniref:Uncharacterized protein n=1 Tax=Ixodes scapularis TaxID=6945 RepID=B7QI52_IXOSC|nr:hypothetical protein IscW_ISCW014210 [Ixodes scapularis]|eukprot:XP_002414859.1 hypothetical protein IscW_ISCW014210 [Ixodes scapularis]